MYYSLTQYSLNGSNLTEFVSNFLSSHHDVVQYPACNMRICNSSISNSFSDQLLIRRMVSRVAIMCESPKKSSLACFSSLLMPVGSCQYLHSETQEISHHTCVPLGSVTHMEECTILLILHTCVTP